MLNINLQNMKSLLIVCLALISNIGAYAQLNLFNYAENSYLSSSQELNSLSEVKKYREQLNIPRPYDEIIDNRAYLKVSYVTSTNGSVSGLVDISYSKSTGPVPDFDKEAKAHYNIMLVDEDESLMITETLKSRDKNAAYFFLKGSPVMTFLIRSVPDGERLLGNVEFKGLTDAQMKAFAKDFVQKMKFK